MTHALFWSAAIHRRFSPAMSELPSDLADNYRPVTDAEVRSWSYGLVKSPRQTSPSTWNDLVGTLDDQAIFGPKHPFRCACGKHAGQRHENIICDVCGVKLTTPEARRHRFGHIQLAIAVTHPIFPSARLTVIPVLSASFVDSQKGTELAQTYDTLVQSAAEPPGNVPQRSFEQLIERLVPLLTVAHEWNLLERQTIAHGMALEDRTTI